MSDNFPCHIRIPLYKLYYIDNIEEFTGLTDGELEALHSEYSSSELESITMSLQWATENRDFDFQSVLPELPQENRDILRFITIILRQIKG